MNQVLIKKGEINIEQLPIPAISENEILVKTHYSLISTGTELAGVSASSQSLISRALAQPHNVKKALKMASEKGVIQTYKIIKGLLDFGTPTGYSLAGEVVQVGANIKDISKGDFVACAGAGIANHAEFVAVPRLLACKVPAGLDLRQAASVTLGAIAMQGVRQANIHLGESTAVIGLGLIGQLTCQLLKSAGCKVIGIDINPARCELAKKLDADHASSHASAKEIEKLTDGFGVDCTIITASTESNEPLKQAMEITRKKGTVVVVGNVGLKPDRSPWYEKEIDLKISCSYGPGRYDETYEQDGIDYPYPYARWTENRNMEEYLRLLSSGRVNFLALNPREFEFNKAQEAFKTLEEEKPLAALLKYETVKTPGKNIIITAKKSAKKERVSIALVGAGAFATITHLPNLEKLNDLFQLEAIVSKKGLTAKQFAKKYGARYCTTDYEEVLKDENIDAVLITTRHNLHAKMVLAALRAGKAVFVEKPLALNQEELNEIMEFYKKAKNPPVLTVGFNRRFSPFAVAAKKLTEKRTNPLLINYRVNAGYIPLTHWTQGAAGGGRIIGEACHFLDFFQYLTNSKPAQVSASAIAAKTKNVSSSDNFTTTIKYKDGSVCTLLYTASGNKDLPKEYAEIYCDGKTLILDDFRKLKVYGGAGSISKFSQDKGHMEELRAFAAGVKSGEFPISLENLFQTTELSFRISALV